MSWILHAHEPISEFVRAGGGKAANLARLSQLGLRVPRWFCVNARAFDSFVAVNGLERSIAGRAADLERDCVLGTVPAEVVDSIRKALEAIGAGEDSPRSVRSSGLEEDSAAHSFAGQLSSYLLQKGEARILECLKRCWASAFSERALAYRSAKGIDPGRIRVAVIVQEMVDAGSSGIAFSRNPVRPLDRDTVVVSSVWGTGEALASGEVDADHFEIDRKTRRIHRIGGLKKASLTDRQVGEVADLCMQLERSLGAPQDCEWAYSGATLFVLQARPITSLPPESFYDARVNGERPILWDNSNIVESFSGVTSPLTFSYASRAYRQVYLQFCQVMGVPQDVIEQHEPVFRNMLGLIRGRIYYNLGCWYQLLSLFPGAASSKAFMETMMGVKQGLKPELARLLDFTRTPPRYAAWRKARLLALTLVRIFRIETIIRDFKDQVGAVYEKSRRENFETFSLQEQIDYFHWLEKEVLLRWKAPIISDTRCMVFFGLLKALTRKWLDAGAEAGALQNDLLCAQGDLASTEPTSALMRIAAEIDRGDPAFREWFMSTPAREAWASMPARSARVHGRVLEFLDRYGFRCANELKLEEIDLHEDPTFAIDALMGFIRTKNHSIEALAGRRRAIRANAEKIVQQKLTGLKLRCYRFILGKARIAVRDREDLRFMRTNSFGVMRRLFRAIGANLHKLGVVAEPRDVFFLTMEEIVAFVEGRSLTLDFRRLVELRRTEFEHYKNTPAPPDRFITLGASGMSLRDPRILADADLLKSELPLSTDPDVLMGTPCCPGIVEGIVRVARTPTDAAGLNGEILVAERTDPGWVPLFPSISGLLIERGSVLSHSAVVARELGIATIIGISGGLMKRLRTGQRVRMDAGRGELRIL